MAATLSKSLSNQLQQLAVQHANSTGFNFTLLQGSDSFGVIPIDPTLTNVNVLGGPIGIVLSNQTFSIPQKCVYAISGSYGFLNRLLYYCLLLFALLVRKNTWLLPAALGVAMTYSIIASIHAFALLAIYSYERPSDSYPYRAFSNPKAYGDLDLYGIYPILISGSVLLMPILNWSSTFKSEKYRSTRPVILCWGVIMFAALVPTMLAFTRGFFPFIARSGLSTCPLNSRSGCNVKNLFNNGSGIISSESYSRCNCLSTCGFATHNDVPMREGSNLQPLLFSHETMSLLQSSSYTELRAVNLVFVFIIIIHGILGLLRLSRTQAERRNEIFSFIVQRENAETQRQSSKFRKGVAMAIAGLYYVTSLLIAVISPLIFISSIVINEIQVWKWPAESVQTIGQWGPWVGTIFAIFAAVLEHYSEAWLAFTFNIAGAILEFLRKPKTGTEASLAPVHQARLSADLQACMSQLSMPVSFAVEEIGKSQKRAVRELQDFWHWLRDPARMSVRNSANLRTASTLSIEKMETQAGDGSTQ